MWEKETLITRTWWNPLKSLWEFKNLQGENKGFAWQNGG